MKKFLILAALLVAVPVAFADGHKKAPLDYGDYSSVTLMVKAWDSLGEGNYEEAIAFTEKCSEMYLEKAREMQSEMTEKAGPDTAAEYWAVNDVGTCYFIRGEALSQLKKYDEAIAAYKVVRDELYYAQAWDTKGWFWSPSDAAYPKIERLEASLDADF